MRFLWVAANELPILDELTPSQDDDARIDACTDLATLERWFDRAIIATSVSDVMR